MDFIIQFTGKAKYLILIHYNSFTSDQLCTLLATQRIYVH